MIALWGEPLTIAYTVAEAALATGRSITRIKRAIREGELGARKDGRSTLIERAELVRWIAAMPAVGRISPDTDDNGDPA